MNIYYKDKLFLGVCFNISKRVNLDTTFIRVLFIIFATFNIFVTFIAYIIALFILPKEVPDLKDKPIRKLYKDNQNKKIFGVCSGLGVYLGVDFNIIRAVFIVALIFKVISVPIAYIIISCLMEFDNDIIDDYM